MNEVTLAPQSTRADYEESFEAYDEDGTAVTLTGYTIVFEIRAKNSTQAEISATTANGDITISGTTFTIEIDKEEFEDIEPGEYDVGCTVEINDFTTQLFVGTIQIYDGVVS